MGRRRRRSGGLRSDGLDWEPPVPGAPSLSERLENGDLPVGLTAEEVARALPQVFDGRASSTKFTYRKFCSYFEEWCLARGVQLAQVETAHLRAYMEEKLERRPRPVSISWLCSTLAAVRLSMRFEGLAGRVNWAELVGFVEDQRRDRGRRSAQSADALTWEKISLVMAAAWVPKPHEWPEATRRRATKDIAIILVMWGCILRRSEAARIRWGDISTELVAGHAYGVLSIPFGKTDPFAKGEVGYIHVRTLAALQEMAVACGRDPSDADELVFGIGDRQISNRIKQACAHARLRGRWSGHSPRVGAAHDLVSNGYTLLETMHAGRWSRAETLLRYVKGLTVEYGAMARLNSDARKPGQGLMPFKIGA